MKEIIDEINKKTKKPVEIKTEITSPFSKQPMDPFGMGRSTTIFSQKKVTPPIDDDYCKCTHCSHCGKRLRPKFTPSGNPYSYNGGAIF